MYQLIAESALFSVLTRSLAGVVIETAFKLLQSFDECTIELYYSFVY